MSVNSGVFFFFSVLVLSVVVIKFVISAEILSVVQVLYIAIFKTQ